MQASAPTAGVSPRLSGSFGPANLHIESLIASDPDNKGFVCTRTYACVCVHTRPRDNVKTNK